MNNQNDVINELANELLITLGLGGFLFVVIVGWIIWFFFNQKVNRIKQTFVSELDKDRATELDLLYRRREVYSRLIKGMRVFLRKGDPEKTSDDNEKNEFLAAYDEAYIWAPDEVLEKLEEYIQVNRNYSAAKKVAKNKRKSISQKEELFFQNELKRTHTACLKKIREDCGFKNTKAEYNFIGFVS